MKTCGEIESFVREKLKSQSETADWFVVSVTMSGGFEVIVQGSEDARPAWRFTLPAEPWYSDAHIGDAFDAALHAWLDADDVKDSSPEYGPEFFRNLKPNRSQR